MSPTVTKLPNGLLPVCLLLPSCVSISVASKPSPNLGWTFPPGKPGPKFLQQVVPGEELGREEQGEN